MNTFVGPKVVYDDVNYGVMALDAPKQFKGREVVMQLYVGSKMIHAKPMNLGDYNNHRGWEIPEDEDPKADGYLVQSPDGHQTWSPALIFEQECRQTGNMTFGHAIECMKKGFKVCRTGWNGKGMWLMLSVPESDTYTMKEGTFARLPYIYMKTAQDELVPWLASQTDVLADDWQLLREEVK